MTTGIPRGRQRAPLSVHLLAGRELSHAMRQLRVAAGDDLTAAVAILNDAIRSLYPQATETSTDGPHLVTAAFLRRVERGHHARLDLGTLPAWINVPLVGDRTRLYTSRVPAWLVRAYDLAFCADGYLVDMYRWSEALTADQLRDLPRRLRDLPAHVPPGTEYPYLAAHFPDPDPRTHAILTAQAIHLARLRDRDPQPDHTWLPSPDDQCAAEDDMPEGLLVRPGGRFVAGWTLHNTGTVPWRDRVLYRVGGSPVDSPVDVGTPPFLIIADTEPGGSTRLDCPMRAPTTPGTYRASLKMGWPNGVYCFPITLLGVFVTIIVPPADFVDPHQDWPDHAG